MSKLSSILALSPLVLLLAFASPAQAQDDPAAYINTIIRAQNDVVQSNLEYVQESVHNPDESAVAAKRNTVIKKLETAITEIGKLPAYKGSSKMATEALAVMKMYQEAYTTDFNEASLLKKTS